MERGSLNRGRHERWTATAMEEYPENLGKNPENLGKNPEKENSSSPGCLPSGVRDPASRNRGAG
jgi:hypothetical protein